MIQSGFPGKQAETIQSYEFVFSVADKKVAEELMRLSRKTMERITANILAMPWRGYSKFVVDSIVAMHDDKSGWLFFTSTQ